MRNKLTLIVFVSIFCAAALKERLFVSPSGWPAPSYDFKKNPLKKEKIQLGRILFYDNALSRNNTISCASCHSPYSAFTHIDHALSHGIDDRTGKRNSPALMNLAWQKTFMWDGAVNHLDVQGLAPISHPDEMGFAMDSLVYRLQKINGYKKLFRQAFGDTIITGEKILKSLSQFMLTLVSANSKYDRVKKGQAQFTEQETKGYALFIKNCSSCHTEPLFTNGEFANNGLTVDPTLNDYGRMKISGRNQDSLLFKVPTLRNIEYSFPYMHDGRFKKLSEVLNHYTKGVQLSNTLAPELNQKIRLSSAEKVDLVAFLLTLSDKDFVFNPAFQSPKSFFSVAAKDSKKMSNL